VNIGRNHHEIDQLAIKGWEIFGSLIEEPDSCDVPFRPHAGGRRAAVLGHSESIITGKRLDGEEEIHNLSLCVAAHESAGSGGKLITID
jgi:hypothetical protein